MSANRYVSYAHSRIPTLTSTYDATICNIICSRIKSCYRSGGSDGRQGLLSDPSFFVYFGIRLQTSCGLSYQAD